MSLRLPIQFVEFQDNGNIGVSSAAGGVAHTFTLPQDTDNVVVKVTASVAGAGASVVFQTTDDGGTTWYDVARTSVVSNGAKPEWLSIPVISSGINPVVNSSANVGSILGGTIGNAAASTLTSRQVSGMPLLSQLARTFTIVEAAATGVASVKTQIKINNQSNRA
jgi:hypothetical protein